MAASPNSISLPETLRPEIESAIERRRAFDAWDTLTEDETVAAGNLYEIAVEPAAQKLAAFTPRSFDDVCLIARFVVEDGFAGGVDESQPIGRFLLSVVRGLSERAVLE